MFVVFVLSVVWFELCVLFCVVSLLFVAGCVLVVIVGLVLVGFGTCVCVCVCVFWLVSLLFGLVRYICCVV